MQYNLPQRWGHNLGYGIQIVHKNWFGCPERSFYDHPANGWPNLLSQICHKCISHCKDKATLLKKKWQKVIPLDGVFVLISRKKWFFQNSLVIFKLYFSLEYQGTDSLQKIAKLGLGISCPKIGQKRTLWCKLGKNLPEKNFLVGRHFMPCSDKLFRFLLPYLASIRVNFGPRGHKILGFSQYWVTLFENHSKSLILFHHPNLPFLALKFKYFKT